MPRLDLTCWPGACLALALLLVIVPEPATPTTICNPACECSIYGGMRTYNCENRGFKDIDPRGTDSHANVNYGDNKIKKIAAGVFTSYSSMRYLNLSHNSIYEIPEDTFKGAPYLEWLDLSYNVLQLQHSMHPNFLGMVQSLSLAGNERIGQDLQAHVEVAEDANMTTWLVSPNLRNLSLANCDLTRFPAWMIRGLTSLEVIVLTDNKLKVLPVLTLVSMCRLSSLSLRGNPWDCKDCNNLRTQNYMTERGISDYLGFKFCPAAVPPRNCDLALVYDEENVRNRCLSVPVPERLEYREPWSFWLIVGVVAGCLIGLVLLSMVCNSVVSAICKKRRTVTQRSPSMADAELMHVLPHQQP